MLENSGELFGAMSFISEAGRVTSWRIDKSVLTWADSDMIIRSLVILAVGMSRVVRVDLE
jgi:hypothetical protein